MTHYGGRHISPLRGRVVVRPTVPTQIGRIVLPPMYRDWQRDATKAKGIKAMSSSRGRVLAMGAPARNAAGVEVPHGFKVGDEVIFVWTHNEANFTHPWEDGEESAWISQEEVQGVIEP